MDAMANCPNKFVCPICGRNIPEQYIEKHHLVPKSKKGTNTVDVCCNCGDMLHKVISIKEMQKEYNTVEALKSHPDVQKWSKWVSKKPTDFSVCMARKKRRN
jgi:5-methylcytosine-specific restriction endonuclease McrA